MIRANWCIPAVMTAALLAAAAPSQAQTGEAIIKVFIDRLIGLVDGNSDGTVMKAEFDAARQSHFSAADQNADGIVTESEFVRLALAEVGSLSRPWTGPVFAAFDRNADGRLTGSEVRATADRIFAHADRNGDGTVTKGEIRPALAMAQ